MRYSNSSNSPPWQTGAKDAAECSLFSQVSFQWTVGRVGVESFPASTFDHSICRDDRYFAKVFLVTAFLRYLRDQGMRALQPHQSIHSCSLISASPTGGNPNAGD